MTGAHHTEKNLRYIPSQENKSDGARSMPVPPVDSSSATYKAYATALVNAWADETEETA